MFYTTVQLENSQTADLTSATPIFTGDYHDGQRIVGIVEVYDTLKGTSDISTATMTTTTTAKQTARAMRVWLENKAKLEQAGFSAGARFVATYGNGVVVLTLAASGKGKVSSCKRGDTVRPIIDLHNANVASVFTAGQSLTVTYIAGTIIIK